MPEYIFLTGATGFLWTRLLAELLRRTEATIHCLVRATGVRAGYSRLRSALSMNQIDLSSNEWSRLEICCGDVSLPNLGLGPTDWNRLSSQVDTIYHCAAQVNVALPYERLKGVNVGGTLEILRLMCEGRTKRMHYASTLSVFVSSDCNTGLLSEDDFLDNTGEVFGGYAQSKWAAEVALRQSRGMAGPIAHYRLGLLTGDSVTAQSPANDWLAMFFRGVASIRCVPDTAPLSLAVDITPVDYAAAAMASLSMGEQYRTFHLANATAATLGELIEALVAQEVQVERVSEVEWERRIASCLALASEPSEAASFLALCRCFGESAFSRHRSMDLFQATGVDFGGGKTRDVLEKAGVSCPQPSPELLQAYVKNALNRGGAL